MNFDSAMNAISSIAQSANKAVQIHGEAEHNRNMLRLQMERDQVELDRKVMADKFDTAQKAITNRMQSFFSEQIQNPDYSSYQAGWDNEYASIMAIDNLKEIGGLTDEEAERFINDRGNALKQGGDNMVAMNKSVSARNYLATSYEAYSTLEQTNGLSLEESYSNLEKRYAELGGRSIDISGKSDPKLASNRYKLAVGKTQYSGKQLIEKAVTDPEYSIDDALREIDVMYDRNMKWVGSDDPSVLASIQTDKSVMQAQMVDYYKTQNSISYTRSLGKAEGQSAVLSQAITDNKIVDENTFSTDLMSALDVDNNKNDKQVYLDLMLNVKKHNLSLAEENTPADKLSSILYRKQADNENIEDIDAVLAEAGISKDDKDYDKYRYQVSEYESRIRSGEESRAKAVYKAAETEIKMMIASGDYAGNTVAYGHNGLVPEEDIAKGNINLSNSIADGLWSISAGSGVDVPAVSTSYGSIVDEISEKYGITDPDEKRILASHVNDAVLEMNRAEAEAEGTSSKAFGAEWNAADRYMYEMASDLNNISAQEVLSAFNMMDAQGMLSNDFKEYFRKTQFGDDGSKRDSVFMRNAVNDLKAFEDFLKVNTSQDVSNRLLYMTNNNGDALRKFESWEMSHPYATADERERFINDLVISVSSSDVADQIQNVISEGYRYATGITDTSPVDNIESIEQVQKFRDGTYSYLIDESAVRTAKQKLYSDSASSMKQDELFNLVIGDISNGRYKTLKDMEDDKNLSEREKTMYRNLTYLNSAMAVDDVVMYKQAEQVAQSINGSFSVAPNAGKNLKEIHVTGLGNAVIDEAGVVYIANGKNSVDIYRMDPDSDEFRIARASSSASVYPTSLTAGGSYSLSHAVEKTIEYADPGQYSYSRIVEGYNRDFTEKKGRFSEGAPVPETGSLAYYGKGGYEQKPSDRQVQINSANGISQYTYIKDEKSTLGYMQNDPALWNIIERLFQ